MLVCILSVCGSTVTHLSGSPRFLGGIGTTRKASKSQCYLVYSNLRFSVSQLVTHSGYLFSVNQKMGRETVQEEEVWHGSMF